MRRFILCAILAFLTMVIHTYPVKIDSWNVEKDVKVLNSLKISVDSVNRVNGVIIAYVRNDSEYSRILDNGFQAEKLPDIARENALLLHQDKSRNAPKDEYYTIDQYNQFMVDTADQYPNICELIQAGTSVQNRPLYFLKITDNPTLEEAEPEFKYISTMHGNEVVGYDMCIRLIQLLTSEYGTNTRITDLVDNTEIWINPLMNPDGYVLGQRYNSQGIDLNRNFPMPTGEQHPDGNAWATENIAIMDLCNDHSFILSANFHTGALVMNYPWDYTYALTPDDDLCQAAALTYSMHNLPMYNSPEFPNGITNGAEWYVITGSMQDWNYGFTDCLEITAEISNDFWPPASTLPTYWTQNQESMLSYMEFVHNGIHGLVTSTAGIALDATIIIEGNDKQVHTDPDVGDYHRMLLPGTYTVTANAVGYLPQTAQVTVPLSGSTVHDFVLENAQNVNFTGQVRDVEGFGIAGVNVTLGTDPPNNATTDALGCFAFNSILEGYYNISIAGPDSEPYETNVLLTTTENHQIFVISDPLQLLNDPCENLDNWTAESPWGVVTYMGEQVITDSPSGNYGNHINRSLRLTNPISLENIIEPKLIFKTTYFLENNYDYVYIQASNTTSDWITLGSLTGSQSSWQTMNYSLAEFAGEDIYIRFVIDTDWSVSDDGIYLDDISIGGLDGTLLIYGDADGNRRISRSDPQSILDHSVGLDPLPDIDPLPWDADRVAACDVDEDLCLTELDAYLTMKYLYDPAFRFEVQSGEEADLEDVALNISHDGYAYNFAFDPPEDLKCFFFQFLPEDGVNIDDFELTGLTGDPVFSYNPAINKFAWIYGSEDLAGMDVQLQTALESIELFYALNGVTGSVTLDPGSALDDPHFPGAFTALAQNYPNPFNPRTTIEFYLPQDGHVNLAVYNSRGQLIKTLVDDLMQKGSAKVVWDGNDEQGDPVSSGIYLYRLINREEDQARKMILLK